MSTSFEITVRLFLQMSAAQLRYKYMAKELHKWIIRHLYSGTVYSGIFFYPEMTDILRFMDWTFNCRRLHRAPSGCIASSAVLWFILIHILSSGIFLCMLIFYFISACYNFLLGKNSQFSANEAQIECDTALCKNAALSDSTEDLCRVHS